jgi:hypothetical protein
VASILEGEGARWPTIASVVVTVFVAAAIMLAANSNSDEDEILCRCWQYNTGRQSVSGEGMNDGAVTVER